MTANPTRTEQQAREGAAHRCVRHLRTSADRNRGWKRFEAAKEDDADADAVEALLASSEHHRAVVEGLVGALERIERWEMPETGLFWENQDGTVSGRPMSYSAAYGSNGERDVIRAIARSALAALAKGEGG